MSSNETYPNGRPVAPPPFNVPLQRDEQGNSLAVPDRNGVPRYLYTDGSMDLNSTVDLRVAKLLVSE